MRSRVRNAVRIATRGSALALAQARMVQAACRAAFPAQPFELCVIKTTGDRLQSASLQQSGASLPKGLFTKELEMALLADAADFAVHSLKDLPTELPDGLRLGGVLPRADVRDVLIGREGWCRQRPATGVDELPEGAVVATSSTRRAAQLRRRRPDLRVVEIRGNVPTRLRKLATTREFDATILAAAGLDRLGIGLDAEGQVLAPVALAPDGWGGALQGCLLSVAEMLPAPGQAAIALECRRSDAAIARVCRRLEDASSRACVEAERAFLAGFGGGCLSPVAAFAQVKDGQLHIQAVAFEAEKIWEDARSGAVTEPRRLGRIMGMAARRSLGRPSGRALLAPP